MTKNDLETLVRWMRKATDRPFNVVDFFYYAYHWKYGVYDHFKVPLFVAEYRKIGRIPNFVQEMWRDEIIPKLLLKGGRV